MFLTKELTGAVLPTTIQEFSVTDTVAEQSIMDPYNVKEIYPSWDIGVYVDSLEVNVLPIESAIKACTALYRRLQ